MTAFDRFWSCEFAVFSGNLPFSTLPPYPLFSAEAQFAYDSWAFRIIQRLSVGVLLVFCPDSGYFHMTAPGHGHPPPGKVHAEPHRLLTSFCSSEYSVRVTLHADIMLAGRRCVKVGSQNRAVFHPLLFP